MKILIKFEGGFEFELDADHLDTAQVCFRFKDIWTDCIIDAVKFFKAEPSAVAINFDADACEKLIQIEKVK
jgi:hypothetical protein